VKSGLRTSCPRALLLGACIVAAAAGSSRSVEAQGTTIDTVRIVRTDVYTGAEASRYWYAGLANRLHAVTRERVVRREVLVRPGERADSARREETARNLRRLGVFTETRVDTVRLPDGRLALDVTTHDGWTTRPAVGFRSVGGQALLSASLIETNIAGLGGTLDLRYIDDPDRTTVRSELRLPRIVRDQVTLGASYTGFSDGRSAWLLAEQPWFALSTRDAWRVVASVIDGRVLRFREGTLAVTDSLTRQQTLVAGEAGHALRASTAGFVRVGVAAQYRREDFAPRGLAVTTRTHTGAVTPFVEAQRANFVVVRNYRLLAPQEDIDLSTAVRLGAAIAPRAFGYDRTGAGPLLVARTGVRLGARAFAVGTVRASGLWSGGALDSGTATIAGTVVWQPDARQTIVAYGNAGWDRDPWPGEEFDLGLVRGPRAFPLHAFTGDRQRFAMVEYKYTIPRVFAQTAVVALAAFAESGGAWFAGDRPRWGHDAGLGLRFGSTRTPQAVGSTRIDLAYRLADDRQPAGFVVVVGSGFPFDFLR
jgi:hypothetical protein